MAEKVFQFGRKFESPKQRRVVSVGRFGRKIEHYMNLVFFSITQLTVIEARNSVGVARGQVNRCFVLPGLGSS